jgi:AcrR family transcriptional regulator
VTAESERPVRRRLGSEARREAILAAAAEVIAAQGFLPISFEAVARAAGASKALVYAYFASQPDLCNAVLARRVAALIVRVEALDGGTFETWAVACAETYFDDVAHSGTLLHILFTDPVLDGRRDSEAIAARDAVWRRLARGGRRYAKLSPRDAVAALAIVLSLPEETGRLAYRGELAADRARALCANLVLSALRGLRSAQI